MMYTAITSLINEMPQKMYTRPYSLLSIIYLRRVVSNSEKSGLESILRSFMTIVVIKKYTHMK